MRYVRVPNLVLMRAMGYMFSKMGVVCPLCSFDKESDEGKAGKSHKINSHLAQSKTRMLHLMFPDIGERYIKLTPSPFPPGTLISVIKSPLVVSSPAFATYKMKR